MASRSLLSLALGFTWLATVGAFAGCRDASQGSAPATQAELLAPGPWGVGTRQLELVDPTRPTSANGSFPGAPERRLLVRLWYPTAPGAGGPDAAPAADGSFPVIGYAHGFLSNAGEAAELKGHLASHGYVVVAPTFPLATITAPGGPVISDMTSQPGDLAFVLDRVRAGDGPAPDVAVVIDSERTGLAGLSLGGGTALLAAYHPTLHLEGIGAIVAHAPASCFFRPALYAARSVPTMILAGDADELVPLDQGPEVAFASALPPMTLVRMRGGVHLGFLGLGPIDGANADRAVGCATIGAGSPLRTAPQLVANVNAAAGSEVAGLEGCTIDVCTRQYEQSMTGTRQLQLTEVLTLAHFEAELRGRRDVREFLREVVANDDPDIEIRSR